MRCYSLTTKPLMVRGSPRGCKGPCGGNNNLPNHAHYPRPTLGLDLDPTDRSFEVGWTQRIPVSPELLELRPESKAIERDGRRVTLLRASVERSDSGAVRFVPERADDKEGAIVYLDVGAGKYLNVHFTNLDTALRKDQILARVRIDDRFGTYDEKLLVQLKPFEPIVAVRSDRRFWLWGQERVRETLKIRFDGRDLFYDTPADTDD